MARGLRNYGVVYPAGLEGETARDAVAGAVSRRGGNLVPRSPTACRSRASRRPAGRSAARLIASGANAVILTDGPTGGLGFIADGAARQRPLSGAGAVPRPAALGRRRRGAGRAEPAGRRLRAPGPGAPRRLRGPLPERLWRGAARAGRACLRGDRGDRGADRRGARAAAAARSPTARLTQPSGFAGVNGPFRLHPERPQPAQPRDLRGAGRPGGGDRARSAEFRRLLALTRARAAAQPRPGRG